MSKRANPTTILANVCALLALLAGCATTPAPDESAAAVAAAGTVPAGRHRLILYRTKEHTLYLARAIPLRLDGRKLPSLLLGEAVYCDVAPGRHVLESETFDYAGRFRLEFTPQEPVVFIEALPRSESYIAGALGGLVSDVAGIGVMVTAGFAEARISGQGGLFALLPRSQVEATKHLSQLKAVPVPTEKPKHGMISPDG
jgi:hypothetical protein